MTRLARWSSRALLFVVALPLHAIALRAQGDTPLERGRHAVETRRFPEAIATLEPIAKADPKDAVAAFWLGRAYFAQNRMDDAVAAFERATTLQPRNATAQFWLGRAYGQQAVRANKFRQALLAKKVQHAFERAVELDPASIEARDGLVDFYAIAPGFMGGSHDKARAQVAAIGRINPLRGHLSAARLATQLADRAAAERELERAVAEFPDSAAGWLQLGILYATTDRYPKAFETVDAWSKRQPNSMAARYQVGRIAAMSGQNLERGEAELKRYLGYTPANDEPTHAGAWYRLGQIHEKQGRRPEALQDYREAVRLDPTLKAAADAAARLAKP